MGGGTYKSWGWRRLLNLPMFVRENRRMAIGGNRIGINPLKGLSSSKWWFTKSKIPSTWRGRGSAGNLPHGSGRRRPQRFIALKRLSMKHFGVEVISAQRNDGGHWGQRLLITPGPKGCRHRNLVIVVGGATGGRLKPKPQKFSRLQQSLRLLWINLFGGWYHGQCVWKTV